MRLAAASAGSGREGECTIKAAQFSRFGGPDVLEIVDLPDPQPGPGEVRIRVRAAGVNASDWKKRQGLMDQELPQTIGYEAAGVVDEAGDLATGVQPGDAVFGLGAGGRRLSSRCLRRGADSRHRWTSRLRRHCRRPPRRPPAHWTSSA